MSLGDISQAESRTTFLLKQSANVYTVMLILAFVFILIGCLFLGLEMGAYDFSVKVSPDAKVSQTAAPGHEFFAQFNLKQCSSFVGRAQDALGSVN